MLPRKFRLTFNEFRKNPQKSFNFTFPLFNFSLKKKESGNSRMVMIVPKSVDKRSSYRHKSKRLLDEMIREKLDLIKNRKDILIRIKKMINKNDKITLEKGIDFLIKRVNETG